MNIFYVFVLIALSLSTVNSVAQTTYKCRTSSGKIEFSDRPCNVGTTTEKVLAPENFPEEERTKAQMRAQREQLELAEIEKSKQRPQESIKDIVCNAALDASRNKKQTARRRTQLNRACQAISDNPDSTICHDMASVALSGASTRGRFTALYEACKASAGGGMQTIVKTHVEPKRSTNYPSRPCMGGDQSDSNCYIGANPQFSGTSPRRCMANDPNDFNCIR